MWLALPAIIFVVYTFYLNQTQWGDSSAGMGEPCMLQWCCAPDIPHVHSQNMRMLHPLWQCIDR